MKIQGRINGIEFSGEGESPKGKWQRWVIILDKLKFSTFSQTAVKTVSIGDLAEIEYTETEPDKDGKVYKNLKDIKKIDGLDVVVEKAIENLNAPVQRKTVKGSAYEKDPVGLAVEVFVSTMGHAVSEKENVSANELMKEATDLVKQAQKAFE